MISYTGGSAAANASCTVQVDVTSSTAGSYDSTSGALTSSLGNSGTANDTLVVTDALAPALTAFARNTPSAETTNADTLVFDITFSEDVVNVTADDFDITGGTTATGALAGSGSAYTLTVSGGDLAEFNGTVGLDLAATQNIEDSAGNALPAGEPATDETYTLQNDITAPTVEILNAPESVAGTAPFDVTLQFSETVVGFAAGDIAVANGSVSGFAAIDGDTYSASITPSGAGEMLTIDVAAGVAQDEAGNDNLAANQVVVGNTLVTDTQQLIAGFMIDRARHILANQPDLIGFLNGSALASNGPLGLFSLQGDEGSMALAFATSLSQLDRAAAARQQSASGEAASPFFLQADGHSTSYGADISPVSQIGRPGAPRPAPMRPQRGYDVWAEVYGSTGENGTTDTSLWLAHLGAHYFLTPDLLVGALAQFDWADHDDAASGGSGEGFGWMVGPYVAGRVAGTGLAYEVRALWGQSDNSVSPLGTFSDDFGTERWLISGKLQGELTLDTLVINPTLQLSYFRETQEAYIDSLTNPIPEQTIALGEARFGPQIGRSFALDNGSVLETSLGLSGVVNFGVDTAAAQQLDLGNGDLRGRLDAGVSLINAAGWKLSASGYYDGLGSESYEAMGGRLRVAIPLQ
ncbi:Ig-like domain-containing protein [Pseudohoeflea coraliihabitans]|uniref:Autotransporter domain-containing protein n=1 Tax=Pseudohoeflea coraliihabitans TaxID=2860393 RepID=A0ABS6WLH7_9HYPH|nr:autotransporter domain-containing protein [Pseudohoeflea sp. DP4N28-3]